MAKERVFTYRNTGTQETPVWEKWFQKTVADAVLMSDSESEEKTIVDYVNEKISDLIGGAPETYDTLKEIADYIASHEDVADALNAAIANKAEKNHTHADATQSASGFQSAADKKKLDGIAAGANNYVHPTTSGNKHIPSGGIAGQILRCASDGTGEWADENDTTYPEFTGASASAAGKSGLVPAPAAGDQKKFLGADGTWKTPDGGNAATVNSHTVESNVPANAKFTDTVYTHPSNHSASMITQDATHRFVTDEEKEAWNTKVNVYFASELPETAPAGSICFLI